MVTLISLGHKERFAEINLKYQNDRLDALFYDILEENAEYNEL